MLSFSEIISGSRMAELARKICVYFVRRSFVTFTDAAAIVGVYIRVLRESAVHSVRSPSSIIEIASNSVEKKSILFVSSLPANQSGTCD